jgi:hypothetical protein
VIRKEVGQEGRWFTVQGDAAAQPDGVIPGGQVYGRVVAIERGGEHFDMDQALMRMLSRLAVLRSRWNFGRGLQFRLATRLVKRLPVFCRYLA